MMFSVVSFFVIACILQAVVDGEERSRGDSCSTPAGDRRDCGWGEISAYECAQRGCCWQECHGCGVGVPWCYQSADAYRAECLVADEDKDDCGSYGIEQVECIRRGCCWTPSDRDNIPWCFQQKVVTTTTTTTQRPVTPPGSGASDGDMRLADGEGPWEGRYELYISGMWGTFCARNFSSNVPDIVCKQFGYTLGGRQEYFPGGEGPIFVDTLDCPDDASEVMECEPGDIMENDCTHEEDFGVVCELESPGSGSGDYMYY